MKIVFSWPSPMSLNARRMRSMDAQSAERAGLLTHGDNDNDT
jgi:hypothetical protein